MHIPFKLKRFLLVLSRSSYIIIKLVIIDQAVKWWLISYLRHNGLKSEITSFLSMVYSWNYGISFGLFRNYYQYSNMLFIVLNSGIIIYLWSILIGCKSILGFIGYSFIIGGAVGNLIDRFINGAVFDFIYFHYKDIGFPVFNLADSFISLGVIILIYDYYQIKKIVEQENVLHYNDTVIQEQADRIRDHPLNQTMNEGD